MQFIIHALDYTDEKAFDRRMAVRPDHLANVQRVRAEGHVICAGGITDETGKLKGSLLVMEFENRQGLDEYLASEPYVAGKVWENIQIETCNVVIAESR